MCISEINIDTSQIIEFIHSDLAYQQALVHIIDENGRNSCILNTGELYTHPNATIKVEGMERYNSLVWQQCQDFSKKYNHTGPVTCHAFLAHQHAPSFPTHTDPDDVIILCCEGIKTMEVNGDIHTLTPGNYIFIPRNTPHRAINNHSSLMLSFGLEQFFVDKM